MPVDEEWLLAKQLLEEENCTCVICGGERIYRNFESGVKPLLAWLEEGVDMMGYSAADRVVGSGAAFLFRLLGVRRVYGRVMSAAAVKVLRAGGIEASWGVLTEHIQNRQKNGLCPMEQVTMHLQDPEEAWMAMREKLQAMKQNKHTS